MKIIGNIIWFILCGLLLAVLWLVIGLLWCITIVGIPIGLQCFKFSRLCLWPFGYEIDYGGSVVSLLLNIIWIVFGGLEICLVALAIGAVLCLSIIGIPFGLQCFKIAKLAIMPFGASIIHK
jgi:uncharacterized membrane protein YccF (DUF307 family)